MPEDNDKTALAWFCENLQELRIEAAQSHWTEILDQALEALRGGAPASDVLQRLGLLPDNGTSRGGDSAAYISLQNFGLAPSRIDGRYVCPHRRCSRRDDADRRGHQPSCVDGTPMTMRRR